MPHFTSVHHVNLTVTDLARSTTWYREVLELNEGWKMEDPEGHWQKMVLLHPSEPLRIVLSSHGANRGEPFSEFHTGMDHLAFTVADREALEAWQCRFDALRVDHSPIKEGATGWLITFRDPDNIQFEMYTRAK